jgi:hypothetical protein
LEGTIVAEWQGSILVSIPTFGTIDMELFANLQLMHVPIHRSIVWHLPRNLPIAEARTQAVERALKDGCNHILFRDYDVLAPPNALNVLMARDVDVICAPYLSKQKPPWPLIIKDKAPTWAWKRGEVVKCDRIGMGCTLIKTELFERLPKPWFQTSHKEHTELGINAPAVQSYTEDIFFCERLYEELGIRPYADTSVFCVHLDLNTRERFLYDPEHHMGTWVTPDGATCAVPPVASDICNTNDQSTPGIIDLTKESEKECESL